MTNWYAEPVEVCESCGTDDGPFFTVMVDEARAEILKVSADEIVGCQLCASCRDSVAHLVLKEWQHGHS
jgi:hypothetical protein